MLIGNYTVLNKTPGRWLGGSSTSHASGVGLAQVVTRGNWGKTGAMRNAAIQEYSTADLPYWSIPDGYGGDGWLMPVTEGGMSSHGEIVGEGEVSAANLAGGRNGDAALSGSGDLAAIGELVVSAIAELSGSGDISAASLNAVLPAIAELSGSGDVSSATLTAIGHLIAALSGSSTETPVLTATGTLASSITVTGDTLSTANVADAIWGALAEGSFTYAHVMQITAAALGGKTSGATFRDLSDTKDRIDGTVSGGDRTAVTYDLD